jgi:putative transposase
MFVTLRGEPYLLWRAVDEHGAELDVLLQKRRDKATARRFFKRVMRSCPTLRTIVMISCAAIQRQRRKFRNLPA